MKKYANWEALNKDRDFEWNNDFALLHFRVRGDSTFQKDGEPVIVTLETLVCDFDKKESVIQVTVSDPDCGCGALETMIDTAKDMVAPAALTKDRSIFKHSFDYTSTDYMRERFADPHDIKDPIIIDRFLLHFETESAMKQYIAELFLKHA